MDPQAKLIPEGGKIVPKTVKISPFSSPKPLILVGGGISLYFTFPHPFRKYSIELPARSRNCAHPLVSRDQDTKPQRRQERA